MVIIPALIIGGLVGWLIGKGKGLGTLGDLLKARGVTAKSDQK